MNNKTKPRLSFKSAMSVFTALFGFLALAAISGCNTTEGIGEDMEAAGEEIQEGAR